MWNKQNAVKQYFTIIVLFILLLKGIGYSDVLTPEGKPLGNYALILNEFSTYPYDWIAH